nr:alpha/beta hydrolase [Ardenticatenales bacterium]
VLVGHGLGGVFVHLYASQHPEQVHGLVLVDPWHEAQSTRRPEEIRAAIEQNERDRAAQFRLLATLMQVGMVRRAGEQNAPPLFTRYPPEVREALYALFLRPQAIDAALEERERAEESFAPLRESGPLGELPLRVITAGDRETPGLLAEQAALESLSLLALHGELAALSTRGQHIIAEESSHHIPLEQPEIVIQAILELIEGSRQSP